MTQSSGNIYMTLTFSNVPRDKAVQIRNAAERIAGDINFSVDYGEPIGTDVSSALDDGSVLPASGTVESVSDATPPPSSTT
ncbi:MAG: hypothetical protein ACJ74Y_14100 [Bryobacteraceae bacterium]|jgi:hypothetical protein